MRSSNLGARLILLISWLYLSFPIQGISQLGEEPVTQTISLQNKYLQIRVHPKGAELISLRDRKSTEYLWQADPTYWASHSPILFPIIGSLKNGEYLYEGRVYTLTQHGFAKDMEFKVIRQDHSSATFSLSSNEQTLKNYPFQFKLRITYTLNRRTLQVQWEVENPGEKDLFFSIGGHPGFNCPLRPDEKRSDYQLVFQEKESVGIRSKAGPLRSGEIKPFLENERTIPLTDDLFNEGALIFSDLQSNAVQLKKGNKRILTFHFEGFPNLGIWSRNKSSPFVCLEPWFGMTDPVYTSQRIEEKEGIIRLPAGKVFHHGYSIELNQ